MNSGEMIVDIQNENIIGKVVEVKQDNEEKPEAIILDIGYKLKKLEFYVFVLYENGHFSSKFAYRCKVLKNPKMKELSIKGCDCLIGKRVRVDYEDNKEQKQKNEGEAVIKRIVFNGETGDFDFLLIDDDGEIKTRSVWKCYLVEDCTSLGLKLI